MLDLITTLLISYGIVYGVTESTLLAPVRLALAPRSMWTEMGIYCAYCVGFWAGGIVGFVRVGDFVDPVHVFFTHAFLTVGSIAILRAAMPKFLRGAHDLEQDLIAEFRALHAREQESKSDE